MSAKTEIVVNANAGSENLQMPTCIWMEMLSAYHTRSRSQEACIIMNTLVKKINYYWKRLYENRVISDMSTERTFWKKLNGFSFSFIVFNGGENPNKTFLNCIIASWKLVCGFRSQTLNIPSFIYHGSRFSKPDTRACAWLHSAVEMSLHGIHRIV